MSAESHFRFQGEIKSELVASNDAALTAPAGVVRVGYIVNQYPMASHSFIRREILALERGGVHIVRIASRGWAEPIVDADDLAERERTIYLLRGGLGALLGPMFGALARTPGRFFAAFRLAMRMAHLSSRAFPYHLAYLAQACEVAALADREKLTHVHAHFGTNSAEIAMLAHILGAPPYSFTVHGPEEFDNPVGLHLREKIERAKFVVAISSYGRSQLYRWIPPPQWTKVRVIHCGLDALFLAATVSPPPAAPRLLCVGRLCEQKGQILLLHAARELVRGGTPFELVLAGDGEMRHQLEQYIAEQGLQRHVRITGWVTGEQVRNELMQARLLVLPSFAEGLPVVLMEAMALSRPVLTTSIAGIPELVRDRVDGWLVPAGDCQSLLAQLREALATSPERLAKMGESGRERATLRHDVNVAARKLAAHFAAAA